MGVLDDKEFYEICAYLNDRCIEFDRNAETPFELYFTINSGFNIYVSGVYTNIGKVEESTGTFIDKKSEIFLYSLQYEGDELTGKLQRDITKYVNKNLYTC